MVQCGDGLPIMKLCKSKKVVLFACVAAFSFACSDTSVSKSEKEKDWVQEEILQQLSEMRREIGTLKTEVASLREQLNRAGGSPRNSGPLSVKLNSDKVLGEAAAKIAIVEFTDYQCPYCARHNKNVMPLIKEKLVQTGKARYVMYDFPLNFHLKAKSAAVAARCAGKQGKYWEMHDLLFEGQRKLSAAMYDEAARSLSLVEQQFKECTSDPAVGQAVDADLAYGERLNVTGTPRFYVGRIEGDIITDVITISGARNYTAFANAVEQLEKI